MTSKQSAAKRAAAWIIALRGTCNASFRDHCYKLAADLLREDRENARLRRAANAWEKVEFADRKIGHTGRENCPHCDLARVLRSLAKPEAKRK